MRDLSVGGFLVSISVSVCLSWGTSSSLFFYILIVDNHPFVIHFQPVMLMLILDSHSFIIFFIYFVNENISLKFYLSNTN